MLGIVSSRGSTFTSTEMSENDWCLIELLSADNGETQEAGLELY